MIGGYPVTSKMTIYMKCKLMEQLFCRNIFKLRFSTGVKLSPVVEVSYTHSASVKL